MIVGIDASNIRGGGGVTHLIELLQHFSPTESEITKIVVWATQATLAKLPNRPWIVPLCPHALTKRGLSRFIWQNTQLARHARNAGCDVLFCPGGTYLGSFKPFVSLSQNMLPFEYSELRRFRGRIRYLKFCLLRLLQITTFRRANGMIFLSDYARREVTRRTGPLRRAPVTIAHGIGSNFSKAPRPAKPLSDYSQDAPLRILYVSTIDAYKHNWTVAEAVSRLYQDGLPVSLDLVGGAYIPSLKRLTQTLEELPEKDRWFRYHSEVPYAELPEHLFKADLAVFASSCENLPITLLEKMSAGLPIACSRMGPMPEVLGAHGLYFDPEDPTDIARTLKQMLRSASLRHTSAQGSYAASKAYSWPRCAAQTFSFIALIAREDHKKT